MPKYIDNKKEYLDYIDLDKRDLDYIVSNLDLSEELNTLIKSLPQEQDAIKQLNKIADNKDDSSIYQLLYYFKKGLDTEIKIDDFNELLAQKENLLYSSLEKENLHSRKQNTEVPSVLIDASLILDVILGREKSVFIENGREILKLVKKNKINGYITEMGLRDIYDIAIKMKSKEYANRLMVKLLKYFNVCQINSETIKKSYNYPYNNISIESAIKIECAKRDNIDVIITLRKKDFLAHEWSWKNVLTPPQFLSKYDQGEFQQSSSNDKDKSQQFSLDEPKKDDHYVVEPLFLFNNEWVIQHFNLLTAKNNLSDATVHLAKNNHEKPHAFRAWDKGSIAALFKALDKAIKEIKKDQAIEYTVEEITERELEQGLDSSIYASVTLKYGNSTVEAHHIHKDTIKAHFYAYVKAINLIYDVQKDSQSNDDKRTILTSLKMPINKDTFIQLYQNGKKLLDERQKANDELYGGEGNDTLNGGEGNDYFYGWNGDEKRKLDFMKMNLREINLAGKELSFIDLSHSDLTDSNLEGINLSNSNLESCLLERANLFHAILENCTLYRVNLRGAKLNKVRLSKSNLSYADLTEADLDNAILRECHLFSANLTSVILNEANLISANLNKANLTNAKLIKADLTGADFSKANLTGADLINGKLIEADLTGADLTGADLSSADLSKANLTGANLHKCNLTNVNLTGANLTNVNLTDANLTDTNLTNANLTNAELTGIDLSHADLTDVNLLRANLTTTTINISGEKRLDLVTSFFSQFMFNKDDFEIFAVYSRVSDSWWSTEIGQTFQKVNTKLASLGIPIKRIFIIPENDFANENEIKEIMQQQANSGVEVFYLFENEAKNIENLEFQHTNLLVCRNQSKPEQSFTTRMVIYRGKDKSEETGCISFDEDNIKTNQERFNLILEKAKPHLLEKPWHLGEKVNNFN